MAQDFRHGHGRHRKPEYQRKSQQRGAGSSSVSVSVSKVWALGFLSALVIIVVYFVLQKTPSQPSENDQGAANQKSILTTASEIKEKAVETVAEVSKKLEPQKVEVEAVKVKQEEQLVEPDEETKFSFYDGLAKSEVVVDAAPISIQLENPYYIQAGTFGSERVALIEKRRLAKMGQELEMSIYRGTKRVYYRLRIGPYTDRLELNKKRNELRKLGVDTLLVKAPR